METNTTVAQPQAPVSTPAPAPAPVSGTAPAPQADAVVKTDEQDNTVSLGQLMAEKNAAKQPGSGTPKAPEKAPDPAPAPAKEEKKPEPTPQTQKDIDYGLGKRIEAERKKWEKQNAPLLQLAKLVQEANPGMTAEQVAQKLIEDRNEALKLSPELAALLSSRGILGSVNANPQQDAEMSDEEANAVAHTIGGQADEIAKLEPGFDLEAFAAKNAALMPAIIRGDISLKAVYFEQNMDAILKKAREDGAAEAVANIRNRNDRVPNPPTTSAPATPSVDFSKMSSKEFAAYRDEAKKAIAQGKRVVLG